MRKGNSRAADRVLPLLYKRMIRKQSDLKLEEGKY
jgi:hypothetical protein